jgi:hypothetical protein
MTKSARDEALRLAREAGFFPEVSNDPNSPPSWWAAGHDPQFVRLIALARQPLLDAINEHFVSFREMFEAALPQVSDGVLRERMRAWLAAAPKPGDGE